MNGRALMSENEMDDPTQVRGGVQEPDDAKGGAPGGMVPRDMIDEDVSEKDDPQEMSSDALGNMAAVEPSVQVPRDGGDNADATSDGGPDADSPSRVGAGSVADTPGRVGDAEDSEGEDATPSGADGA